VVGMEEIQMEVVRNGKSESTRIRDGRQEDSSRVGGRGEISGKVEEDNWRWGRTEGRKEGGRGKWKKEWGRGIGEWEE